LDSNPLQGHAFTIVGVLPRQFRGVNLESPMTIVVPRKTAPLLRNTWSPLDGALSRSSHASPLTATRSLRSSADSRAAAPPASWSRRRGDGQLIHLNGQRWS
jgi:hypothetical protein